ncbi:hypothetical protein NLU13_0349 [Sarocladium strictum]|uniref:Uncharacterized protein n=1 Tax=Sarocladium strictum TaxID=5046 RepID=A0AA39GP70_SARSR|nr:hypothetical protein NLU13_0349 [Sarocladium strictum]
MSAPTVSSQTSSHFTLEPISADILADDELRRRNGARALGLVRSGCRELDGYVLQGGLERGGVVGISSEDEIFGLSLGLQMLACGLCDESISRGMVVTPKPVMSVAGELRDIVRREALKREAEEAEREEGSGAPEEEEKLRREKVRGCLDRVMLSQVFDVDGLWEILAELDEPDENNVAFRQDEEEEEEDGGTRSIDGAEKEEGGRQVMEVKDSQDGEDSPISIPDVESPGNNTTTLREEETPHQQQQQQQQQQHHQDKTPQQKQPPGFILITHFSSLLTTLFTHREKSAAHSLLQLLSSRLHYLSRSLPSQPLIMLLNSTTTSSSSTADSNNNKNNTAPQKRDREGVNVNRAKRAPDATLRSVFNPPEIPGVQGYVSRAAAEYLRRNKPMFGLVFSQLLDVHLLCTRGEDDGGQQAVQVLGGGDLMVVEVLLDEMGVWEGSGTAPRKMREQRWGALKLVKGRIVDGVEERGKVVEDVRVVAGFGGPRV